MDTALDDEMSANQVNGLASRTKLCKTRKNSQIFIKANIPALFQS